MALVSQVITGSGNGLAPFRHQAIIKTHDDSLTYEKSTSKKRWKRCNVAQVYKIVEFGTYDRNIRTLVNELVKFTDTTVNV